MDRDKDSNLMRKVQEGDLGAFEVLVNEYKQPVVALIYRMLRDLDESEDVAQQVFIQMYKAADRYNPEAKFSTWLFTIARNLGLNEIRRRSRHPSESIENQEQTVVPHSRSPSSAHRQPAPGEELLSSELRDKVEEALQDLPESQRTALILFAREGLSYQDISTVLGTSLSATKSIIHRARTVLKTRLKGYLQSGEWVQS